jgi:hypothetical protein
MALPADSLDRYHVRCCTDIRNFRMSLGLMDAMDEIVLRMVQ